MKFKEIKPGMVIHCQTEEDARTLYKHCDIEFYQRVWDAHKGDTCYHLCGTSKIRCIGYGKSEYYLNHGFKITEFSDLIEPDDSPITAEELLRWLFEHYNDGEYTKVFGSDCGFIELMTMYEDNVGEIIQKITAYEAAKKAPKPVEVEWVDVCRIIQIQDNDFKKCVYEEDLKDYTPFSDEPYISEQTESILKKYVSEHEGRYIAVIDHVCRVKESES